MANTAYRRMKRKSPAAQAGMRLLKGLAAAIGLTVLLIVLFALIVGMTDAADGVIRVVNQLIKIAAVLLGVHIAVEKGGDHGAMLGGLLGFAYMGAGVLVYALGTGQQLSFSTCLLDVCMGISTGGLYGMLRGAARVN